MAESNDEVSKEQVESYVQGLVDTYAKEAFKQYNQPQQEQHQQVRTEREEAAEQLRQTLDPYIRPGLNAAQFAAADVSDKLDFYLKHPDLADIADDVEKMFNDLKGQGRAFPRADIAKFLIGKMATEDPEKFEQRSSSRKKAQLDKLSGATDVGMGSLDRAKNDPVWSNVRNMTLEELEKNLDGVTF